jgi:hypothetical protein
LAAVVHRYSTFKRPQLARKFLSLSVCSLKLVDYRSVFVFFFLKVFLKIIIFLCEDKGGCFFVAALLDLLLLLSLHLFDLVLKLSQSRPQRPALTLIFLQNPIPELKLINPNKSKLLLLTLFLQPEQLDLGLFQKLVFAHHLLL